ncbi:hypothetical protein ACSBR1_039162 [Camellia fascicularis]
MQLIQSTSSGSWSLSKILYPGISSMQLRQSLYQLKPVNGDDGSPTTPATHSNDETDGWQPPPPSGFKINCDETFSKATAKASIAGILRDSEGRLLDGQVSSLLSSSTQQVEAQAVRLACFLAKNHNLPSVEIESDNQTIVKLCV